MWDLIVSVPDHCLSFYFDNNKKSSAMLLVYIVSIWAPNAVLFNSSRR